MKFLARCFRDVGKTSYEPTTGGHHMPVERNVFRTINHSCVMLSPGTTHSYTKEEEEQETTWESAQICISIDKSCASLIVCHKACLPATTSLPEEIVPEIEF